MGRQSGGVNYLLSERRCGFASLARRSPRKRRPRSRLSERGRAGSLTTRPRDPNEQDKVLDHVAHVVADCGREHAARLLQPVGVKDAKDERVSLLA
jgi:hypothetical protein